MSGGPDGYGRAPDGYGSAADAYSSGPDEFESAPGGYGSAPDRYVGGRDARDEETVALAAAIRAPWTAPAAQPYAPAVQPRPPYAARTYPQPVFYPPPYYPPRPIGYVPMPVYAYPVAGPSWAPVSCPRVSRRELGVAYVLWLFLGVLGVHHFYLGNILRGIAYLLTGGFLGVGLLVDLFLLPSLTRRSNALAIGRRYPMP